MGVIEEDRTNQFINFINFNCQGRWTNYIYFKYTIIFILFICLYYNVYREICPQSTKLK